MLFQDGGVSGAFGEVLFLAGVFFHVEELFAVFTLVVDYVFVAFSAHHAAGDAGVIGSAGEACFCDDVIAPFFRLFSESEWA